MSRAWHYLERLSRHAHRGSATAAEAAAAADLRRWLEELGYRVQEQPFRAPRDTLYLGPAAVMVAFLEAAVFGLWFPGLALLGAALFLGPMVGEMLGSRLDFDRLLPLYASQNVVARRPGAGDARQTLVISAHYDTQRASYLFHPRFAPWLQPYFNMVYASLMLIPAGLALRWAFPGAAWPTWVLGIGSALTALNVAFLLICRFTGKHINGANDNGSGVALLLALAERWAKEPLTGVEPIFLLTGAEEVGTRGMKHFVRHCGLDPASTFFINLDNLGAGTLHYLAGEGMLAYKPYCERLCALAETVGTEHPALPGGIRRKQNLLLPTDGLPPTVAGFRTITFIAFSEDGQLVDYHWYTDRLDHIDQALLASTESFLWAYLRRTAGYDRTVDFHTAAAKE